MQTRTPSKSTKRNRLIRKAWASNYRKIKDDFNQIILPTQETDDLLLDVCAIPFVTLPWLLQSQMRNPVWLTLVGVPGCGKTIRLEAFAKCDDLKLVSILTPNALMSGFRDDKGTDFSLLPQLHGKILGIKDFTAMLQQPREGRDACIGQLRDAYDGSASKATGVTGLVSYVSKFNAIFLCTPIIDQYFSVGNQLGERFLTVRMLADTTHKTTLRSMANILNGAGTAFADVQLALAEALTNHVPRPMTDLPVTHEFMKWVAHLARFECMARTHLARDRHSLGATQCPSIESPTRFANQLLLVACGHAALYGRFHEPTIKRFIVWIARNSKASVRYYFLFYFWRKFQKAKRCVWFRQVDIMKETKLGRATITPLLLDWVAVGLIDTRFHGSGQRLTEYRMQGWVFEYLEKLDYFWGTKTSDFQPGRILAKNFKRKDRD